MKTNVRPIVFRLLGLGLLLSACNFPTQPAEDLVATAVAATLAPPSETATAEPGLLPAAVLFLSERSGSPQMWHLAADGVSQTQLSDEAGGVSEFDVSPLDGSLAYVSDNQLYLRDADGSNRRLMVDNAAADPTAPDYFGAQRISAPRFSPDGRYLAYAFDGLWVLDLSSNQAVHLLNNEIDPDSEALQTYFTPLSWAPNGQHLALASGQATSGLAASQLAFFNPGAEPLVTQGQSGLGPACCQAAWAPDSGALWLASPYAGLVEPGLWRYDPLTGARRALLSSAEGLLEFAGWPSPGPDDTLRYFYASTADPQAGDVPLFMVSSPAGDPAERSLLREEAFPNVGEVLWAPDGSLALVVQLRTEGGQGGAVLLVYPSSQPPQRLLEDGYALRWGR